MSDFNIRGKLPFNVVSSSVNTGYAAGLSASVKQNIAIINHHRDDYSELEGTPIQGPFTSQHVGGNQHRHASLNLGNDNTANRSEAYIISSSVNSIKIYGPDINGIDKPRAIYSRGLVAKSPLNISNIQTSGNVAGNFEHNYQVVQAVGRTKLNNLIIDGFEATGPLTTKFIYNPYNEYTLPNIQNNSKSIFVERFNAPGGKEESCRGALNREGEEYAPNNSLVTRNIKIRQPFYRQLTQHAAQFNSGSSEGVTIHAVNRNSLNRLEYDSSENPVTSSRNDNFWVQHAIPSTDLRYAWISSSKQNNQIFEYQQQNNVYNSQNTLSEIQFVSASEFGDFIGISGAVDKNDMFTSNYTNTMYRDKRVFSFKRRTLSDFYLDLSNVATDVSNKDFTFSFWTNYSGTVPLGVSDTMETFKIFSLSGSAGIFDLFYNANLAYNFTDGLNSFLISPNNKVINSKTQKVKIWDEKWHLITFVKDITSSIRRITTSQNRQLIQTIKYYIYVDGGLVAYALTTAPSADIKKIEFFNGKGLSYNGNWPSLLGDILIWDRALSADEINEFYLLSKNGDNKPKKYVEYSGNNLNISNPLHVYSSNINLEQNILYDEVGNKNVQLINFNLSKDYEYDLNKNISYSTYFNGPYQGASWKFLKHKEHPVVRKLTTENTNITSVLINNISLPSISTRTRPLSFNISSQRSKKEGTLLNIKEPPININNKPFIHKFFLKDSFSSSPYRAVYSYTNNLEYFTNKNLDTFLGLKNEEPQMYDTIYNFYANSDIPEEENPFEIVSGYIYSETIFPKKQNAFLKESRGRIDYITDESGFGYNGYDRQFGTQRVFWRDDLSKRQRTEGDYINSLGYHIATASYGTTSIRPAEYIETSSYISKPVTYETEYCEFKFKNAGELFNNSYHLKDVYQVITKQKVYSPISSVPEIYFYKGGVTTGRETFYNPYYNGVTNSNFLTSYRAQPTYVYQHFYSMEYKNKQSYVQSGALDLGLNRYTEIISGKKPWYDNYESYAEDIRPYGKSYSIIPEFNISNNIKDAIKIYGGDFRKINLKNYISDIAIAFKDKLEKENSKFFKQNNITLNVDVIKKLLPYNGFYPIDRSIQLVNDLKDSYIDTESVVGGLLLTGSYGSASFYDSIVQTSSYTLERFAKESAFLEPFYAPGIFYNMIKSGLAVNWSVYTGSLAEALKNNTSYTALANSPTYKIPFESILDIFSGLPIKDEASNNKILKNKEILSLYDSSDYISPGVYSKFQYFFELQKKSNPLYSLNINNFLAETINFFLKDSSLNTFVSQPENTFKSMDRNKTYYMDVVLKKTDDFKMVDAFSSSINDLYGNMSGRYFGPSFWTGSVSEKQNILNSDNYNSLLKDPGYCIYAPPYFYGESIARISFKPPVSRQYTLYEIIGNSQITYINRGLNDLNYISGTLYAAVAMNVGDSVDLFNGLEERLITIKKPSDREDIVTLLKPEYNIQNITNQTGNKKWVISTKMETPILNFINQEYTRGDDLIPVSKIDQYIKTTVPDYVYPTASGFGIGMWSGYGEIPIEEQGIFFELRESFPEKFYGFNSFALSGSLKVVNSTTGSLIDICGFQKQSKRVGELADQKTISEAIVIIPYSTSEIKKPRATKKGGETITYGTTTKVEDFNFFRISNKVFNKQNSNISQGNAAVMPGDFGAPYPIQNTSISNMISLMRKYVIPPNLNFLEYSDIKPFIMYIVEFESTLDKQDLADIWQGVMPTIATKAELDQQTITHGNNIHEFFHGGGLPENIKFLVFKVKKKAEINYYKMTAKSTDDNLFNFDFEVGKKAPEYSYNWPYDYCSLIELAKVDIELDYSPKETQSTTTETGTNTSPQQQTTMRTRG